MSAAPVARCLSELAWRVTTCKQLRSTAYELLPSWKGEVLYKLYFVVENALLLAEMGIHSMLGSTVSLSHWQVTERGHPAHAALSRPPFAGHINLCSKFTVGGSILAALRL